MIERPISTRNLADLPDPKRLRKRMQSLALLDSIMSPEWQDRYYSFDSTWGPDEQMGSMRNGSGDHLFVLFNPGGCFIKGYVRESVMTPGLSARLGVWPGVLDGVPSIFQAALGEPAFTMENTTFCIWRELTDSNWQRGSIRFPDKADPDGSAYLLAYLDKDPDSYCRFAEEYYECALPVECVRHLYDHRPLSDDIVQSLNNEVRLADLAEDLKRIDYPNG